jgi:hypothetical protein
LGAGGGTEVRRRSGSDPDRAHEVGGDRAIAVPRMRRLSLLTALLALVSVAVSTTASGALRGGAGKAAPVLSGSAPAPSPGRKSLSAGSATAARALPPGSSLGAGLPGAGAAIARLGTPPGAEPTCKAAPELELKLYSNEHGLTRVDGFLPAALYLEVVERQELPGGETQVVTVSTTPVIQRAPAEKPEEWVTMPSEEANPGTWLVETGELKGKKRVMPDGLYDLRAKVEGAMGCREVEASDKLLDLEEAPILNLTLSPPKDLAGVVTLTAQQEPEPNEETHTIGVPVSPSDEPDGVKFEYAEHGSHEWHEVRPGPGTSAVVTSDEFKAAFQTLQTRELPSDGHFDFRAVSEFKRTPPSGAPEQTEFSSIPVRDVLVDHRPPEVSGVTVKALPGPQEGVALSAQARDLPPASGVGSVSFEAAPVGTSAWKALPGGTVTVPGPEGSPSSCGSDFEGAESCEFTHALHEGVLGCSAPAEGGCPYQFRALATDRAGNTTAPSAPMEARVPYTAPPALSTASVSSVVAPAENITVLGTVAAASSPRHETETWAWGITHAPPATVEGSPLEYTAEKAEPVLLRSTERSGGPDGSPSGGWQIVDVLRAEGGEKPYELLAPSEVIGNGLHIHGTILPSGEGWLTLLEQASQGPPRFAMFHRTRGGAGHFEFDSAATKTLEPLPGEPALLREPTLRLRVREDSQGHVFGILTAGLQKYSLLEEAGGGGGPAWSQPATPPNASSVLASPCDKVSSGPLYLKMADVQGVGDAWGAFGFKSAGLESHEIERFPQCRGLILGHLYAGSWHFMGTLGLPGLDMAEPLAGLFPRGYVEPAGLTAQPESNAVWLKAQLRSEDGQPARTVLARYEAAEGPGSVTASWCSLPLDSCNEPLGVAALPEAFFGSGSGLVALSLQNNAVRTYTGGRWTSVPAPGHEEEGGSSFTAPGEGWLGGKKAAGRWSAEEGSSLLTPWPLADRWPLTSVALPPGGGGALGESGALAVGFRGAALRYEAGTGWQVEATPPRAQGINLLGVAFDGATNAFAVGQYGAILEWNGAAWTESPQSVSLTRSQLDSVAFAPSGEGWAVGANGTILHYAGGRWGTEEPPKEESGSEITSVAVAGSEVYAVAGGNLITRSLSGGSWERVTSGLPGNLGTSTGQGPLRLLSGLPDGGMMAAGVATVITREAAGQPFQIAPQPLSGVAVALAAYRGADHKVSAYVSVAPPVGGSDVAGFPAGDGDVLRETETGWQDVGRSQYAGNGILGDGALKSDPVLALAAGSSGEALWAAGGYDGTDDAAGQGSVEPLSARSLGWATATIWRYETGGSAQPPGLSSAPPSVPAKPGVVSFAFFTSPECKQQCSSVPGAQPTVNLNAAANQIAAYAAQPGGPAFAILGGNAVGPLEPASAEATASDFARLPELLAPLGGLPIFAAFGLKDVEHEAEWAESFAASPPPFGSGHAAGAITPVSGGAPSANGDVRKYYSFDVHQNGATLRVIVLDNAERALGVEQRTWLEAELNQAQSNGVHVVVMAATPLQETVEEPEPTPTLELLLAEKNVLAVFTGSPKRIDQQFLLPKKTPLGVAQVLEYEGASLGYQKPQNDGVKWYFVSVNTQGSETRGLVPVEVQGEVRVQAIPVIASLALRPLDGHSVPRSLTLRFEALARRPAGSLATIAGSGPEGGEEAPFPGYSSYAEIPAASCGTPPPGVPPPCVPPSYSFTSSDPTVGQFVEASGPGSRLPRLEQGHPIPSSTSGLFCAYNAGTTTVSVTAGLLSYSLPVTVAPGGFGYPCGTVPAPGRGTYEKRSCKCTEGRIGGAVAPPPPAPAATGNVLPASIVAPPPAPAPPVSPAPPPPPPTVTPKPIPPAPPPPVEPVVPVLPEPVGTLPTILPAATPPVEPIPPAAGGFAQSPAAAKKREEVRKHASESAFTIRAAATGGLPDSEPEWFLWAVGGAALVALLLSARGVRGRPRPRPATVPVRVASTPPPRRRSMH